MPFQVKRLRPEDEESVPDLGMNLDELEEVHTTFLKQGERAKKVRDRISKWFDSVSDWVTEYACDV